MKKRRDKFLKNHKGQVWIETVIYTLIAFVMIGLVLSYARPKIEEIQDRAIVQQSIGMMKQIDSTILAMGGTGNQRILELGIKEGSMEIDGIQDKISFELESQSIYSEPGKEIRDGSIIILTETRTGFNLISLTMNYSENYNLRFNGEDQIKIIPPAAIPYKISILNEGEYAGKTILNMSII